MAKKNYELTEAEWSIIAAVWENEPCAAPTVQEALHKQKKWSYSTVKTMMDRMAAKGLKRSATERDYAGGKARIQRGAYADDAVSAG
jgi:predicted transcriptional regulator